MPPRAPFHTGRVPRSAGPLRTGARSQTAPVRRSGDAWGQLAIPAAVLAVLGVFLGVLFRQPALAVAAGAGGGTVAAAATTGWVLQSAGRADAINPWRLVALALFAGTAILAVVCRARGTAAEAWAAVLALAPWAVLAIARAVQVELRLGAQRRLTLYLAAELGVRPGAGTGHESLDLLRVRRWRGWHGVLRPHPRAGHIVLPLGIDEQSPDLHAAIRGVFAKRTGVYVSLRPDPRRDRILFRATAEPDQPPEDPHLARLRQVVESLGKSLPDPRVSVLAWAEDAPDAMPSAVEVFPVAAFRVGYAPTPSLGNPGVRSVICAELGQMLYGDPNCLRAVWRRYADEVEFTVRPEMPTQLPNPVLDLDQIAEIFAGELVLPLAVDEGGELLGWQLTHTTRPHALVVGPTGGGKTVAILGLALAAVRAGVEVRGVDPKYIELRGLRGWPGVKMLATGRSVPDMVGVVEDTFAEMHRRYDRIDRGLAGEDDFQRILLILDEYYIFVEQCNNWWKAHRPKGDRRSTHPVIERVGELAAMARGASIHLLLGVQRPDSAFFPAGARDNFRFRVALAELSPEGNRMMWERDARELPRLPADLPGRAIVSTPTGPGLGQVFWTPNPARFRQLPEEDRALIRALVPAGTTWDGPPGAAGAALTKPGPTPPAITAPTAPASPAAPSAAERLLALLTHALRSRTAHLTAADGGGPPHPAQDIHGYNAYGWRTGSRGLPEPGGAWIGCLAPTDQHGAPARVQLLPAAAVEVARHMAAAMGEPFTASRPDIDDALGAAGMLATEQHASQTRRTVRRTLPGVGRVRVWEVPASLLTPDKPLVEAGPHQADGLLTAEHGREDT